MNKELTLKVIDLLYDLDFDLEHLWWHKPNQLFMVNCNDVFYWACADAEFITEENLPILEQSLNDSIDNGFILFVARVRKIRPQGAIYKHIDKEDWPLFDACGPEREIDIGNPFSQDNNYLYKAKCDIKN